MLGKYGIKFKILKIFILYSLNSIYLERYYFVGWYKIKYIFFHNYLIGFEKEIKINNNGMKIVYNLVELNW